jgi:hypothetical protein
MMTLIICRILYQQPQQPDSRFLLADVGQNNFGRYNPMRWAQKRQRGTAPLRLGNVRQRNLPGIL